jgi:molybdopterin converting factor small subunit
MVDAGFRKNSSVIDDTKKEEIMKINLKCFADLAEQYTCDHEIITTVDIDAETTVDKMMSKTGIDEKDVKIVMINGKISGIEQTLDDGDNVTLVPATGGM